MITLRPYQATAVESIKDRLRKGDRSVLFVLPTGGGKTVIFSYIAQQAASKGSRVCIVVHRVELLDQASRSLTAMGIDHGLIASGRSMNLQAKVQVASVGTLARRLDKLPADLLQLLIIDEAHHSNAETFAQIIQHFHTARLIGVTATPIRGDGKGLGAFYQSMVIGPSSQWLTDNGFLAPAKVFAPPLGFTVKGLRKRMGDFDMSQAGAQLAGAQIMGDAVGHYLSHLDGKTAITFCCSIAHAVATAEAFVSRGINAASIDGTMDAGHRRQLLADLGAGELKVLTSCSLIGEGVDVPSVAGCIMLRPTQSLGLHLQMIGRALRPQENKQAIVLDHVGNVERLGHHLDEQPWSLDGVPKAKRDAAPSVKVCPKCFIAMSSRVSACENCGHEFQPDKKQLVTVAGQLQEIERNHRARLRKQEQAQAQTIDQLIAVGNSRGMKNPHGWAQHIIAARRRR